MRLTRAVFVLRANAFERTGGAERGVHCTRSVYVTSAEIRN